MKRDNRKSPTAVRSEGESYKIGSKGRKSTFTQLKLCKNKDSISSLNRELGEKGKMKKGNECEQLFLRATKKGITPNAATFTALVNGLVRSDHVIKARKYRNGQISLQYLCFSTSPPSDLPHTFQLC